YDRLQQMPAGVSVTGGKWLLAYDAGQGIRDSVALGDVDQVTQVVDDVVDGPAARIRDPEARSRRQATSGRVAERQRSARDGVVRNRRNAPLGVPGVVDLVADPIAIRDQPPGPRVIDLLALVGVGQYVEARRTSAVRRRRYGTVRAVDEGAQEQCCGVGRLRFGREVRLDLSPRKHRRVDAQAGDRSLQYRIPATRLVAKVEVTHRRQAGIFILGDLGAVEVQRLDHGARNRPGRDDLVPRAMGPVDGAGARAAPEIDVLVVDLEAPRVGCAVGVPVDDEVAK